MPKQHVPSTQSFILRLARRFIVLIVLLSAIWLLDQNQNIRFHKNGQVTQELQELIPQAPPPQINTPPALRAKEESQQSFLTVNGVIEATNRERERNNVPPLTADSLLNQSAQAKARDMFEKQYFAHDSPDGQGARELASIAGYSFIAIGENLALGNFTDDQTLVDAWMDSPGHRENILQNRYRQIGVAVLQGTYEGEKTWIAVQHFGLPQSACSQPDTSLKERIEENKNRLEGLNAELQSKKEEIEQMKPKSGDAYNQKADEYNARINQYNTLIEETKKNIDEYNSKVNAFNQCAS